MPSQAIANAFLILWVWPSHFALPLLVATILFARPRVERHPAFVNMCITEMIGGICMSILLYTNHFDVNGPQPPKALCVFQASLLAGANTLTNISLLGLVYQVYASISAAASQDVTKKASSTRTTWLFIVSPYTVWLALAFGTAFWANSHVDSVTRGEVPYCAANSGILRIFIAALNVVLLLATLVLEVLALRAFLHVWRGTGRESSLLDLSTRIGAFALLITVALVLAAAAIFMPGSPAPDLVMSTMGTFVILIFGTQRDILRAWATWFRLPSHLHPRTTVSVVSRRPSARAFPSPGGLTTSASMLSPDPRAQFSTIASVDSVPTMEGIPPMRERDEKDPELGRPLSVV